MITYDNVKICSVTVNDTYYDQKKKKHIKYAKPKVTKKLFRVFVLFIKIYV
jgi:hypothetical protein